MTRLKTPCPECGAKHYYREFVEAGGCPTCGTSLPELYNLSNQDGGADE